MVFAEFAGTSQGYDSALLMGRFESCLINAGLCQHRTENEAAYEPTVRWQFARLTSCSTAVDWFFSVN
jgi:hypothetical protein